MTTRTDCRSIVLDESDLTFSQGPNIGIEFMSFVNTTRSSIDASKLMNKVREIPSLPSFRSLSIEWNSRQENLALLELFPGLEVLTVNGRLISTFAGIEHAQGLRVLCVDTGQSRKRRIDGIEMLPLRRLEITPVLDRDFDIVAQCRDLEILKLRDVMHLRSLTQSGCHVRRLTLVRCKDFEISDLDSIAGLQSLSIAHSPKLRSIGPSLSVESLSVETCNHLDLRSIRNLPGLKTLHLRGLKLIETLAFLPDLPQLAELIINGSRLATDDASPILESSSLMRLWIPLSNHAIENIGTQRPAITVTNGRVCYKSGIAVDPAAFY